MMMVRKRVLALALVLCLIVLAIPTAARAESPTVFEVSTNEELAAAATQIRGATEGDFVISLQADLTPESCSVGTAGTANVNVTILGNGHTISGIRNFDVSGGTHLTMGKADGTDTLTVVGVNNIETVGIVYVGGKNASFTMYDGVTLKDHQGNNYFGGGVTVRSGTFKMYGGTIENCGIRGGSVCFGGGVAVYGGGAFYMYGGTIKDCYALTSLPSKNVGLIPWGAGGGVFIGGGSTFYMEGGTIENCQASETGGGVFVVNSVDSYYANSGFGYLDSQFEMTGGKITGCSAPYYGGGVAVNGYYVNASGMAGITPGAGHPDDPGVFLTGGEISGNQAEVCGGGLFLITLNTDNAADAVKICNNTADGEGADLFVQSASVTLSDPGKWGVTYLGEPDDVTGKIIDGWYEDFEGERFADQDGDSRVQVTEYETLTADSNTGSISLIAAANPREVTVSFDANGHGTAPQAQTIPMGGTAVKPQDPQERGWVFGGWYMEPACVTEFDFTTPVSENITLYAKWTRAEVTVCFDANGHGTAPQAQTVFMDDTAQRPQDPTEEGWVFGGWYTEPACATEFDFTTPVSENITLYAKWTRA
ncbi:MAG: InlB B-repeat-containing protein, partial [Faecousia sp.]